MAGWIGAALSAASGATSGIVGALQSAKARRNQRKLLDQQTEEAKNRFNHDYYQDLTQKSDAQYLLRQMRERNIDDADRARKTAVVSGKTTEAEAASKAAGAKAVADATARIGSNNAAAKERAVNRYSADMNRINTARNGFEAMGAQAGANLLANGVTTLGNVGAALASRSIWDNDLTTDKEDDKTNIYKINNG